VRLQALARRTAMLEQPAAPDTARAGRLIPAGLQLTCLSGLALGFWLRRHLQGRRWA
jgi:hypothetical protein